jgi:predicted lipase
MGNVGSGYCALDNNRKVILLVFRGTASRRDWISNIDFLPTKYQPISSDGTLGDLDYECDDCKVHRGFYNILKTSMVPVIEKTLALKQRYPDYQLWVIGHSLGGALTFLTGLEFQLLGLNPLVVSFASPKIGDKNLMEFADRHFKTRQVEEYIDEFHNFNRGYIRVTHKGDIVPQLPPSIFYRHSGYEYFISKKDLPQGPEDLVRKGEVNLNDNEDKIQNATIGNPTKYWPAPFLKNEHVSYFIRISGCDD